MLLKEKDARVITDDIEISPDSDKEDSNEEI